MIRPIVIQHSPTPITTDSTDNPIHTLPSGAGIVSQPASIATQSVVVVNDVTNATPPRPSARMATGITTPWASRRYWQAAA